MAFAFEDILVVEASSVPVRIAPLATVPLATGWQDGLTDIGEVMLRTGDYVSVDLGPLHIGDTAWYRVLPAENGVLHAGSMMWDVRLDGPNGVEAGWIAAAVGADANVSLQQAAAEESGLDGLPLLASATGDLESDTFQGLERYLVEWAYASLDGQPTQCGFYVALVTEDRSASLVVIDRGHTGVGAYHEEIAEFGAGDGRPVVGEIFGPLFLSVASGCTWSIRVQGLQG